MAFSKKSRRSCSLRPSACSIRRLSEMSRKISTQPATRPSGRESVRAVVDRPARPVAGNQDRMVCEANDRSSAALSSPDFRPFTGRSLTTRKMLSSGCPAASARDQRSGFGRGVGVGDAALGVGGDDGIADAGQVVRSNSRSIRVRRWARRSACPRDDDQQKQVGEQAGETSSITADGAPQLHER